jgi:hypothetical protein
MINTLLTKVGDLLEKDFLFASLLPALLFLTAIGWTLFAVLGFDTGWAFIAQLSVTQLAVLATVGTIGLLVLSYVLNALRTPYAKFWAGIPGPFNILGLFHEYGKSYYWREYQNLKREAEKPSFWGDARDDFETQLRRLWNPTIPTPAPDSEVNSLIRYFDGIRPLQISELGTRQIVFNPIYAAYKKYDSDSLQPVFEYVKAKLLGWDKIQLSQAQTAKFKLDRNFGFFGNPASTQLGNIIASYNEYAYSRYRMEAEIYWSRLRAVIPKEYLTVVEEPRILMDFALTTASLGLIYSVIALFIGPWLWFNQIFWVILAIAGGLVAFAFYRIAVGAAYRFGELVRSSFDLYRLDLMAAFNLPIPTSHTQELTQWSQVDQLIVYGNHSDFTIQKVPKP